MMGGRRAVDRGGGTSGVVRRGDMNGCVRVGGVGMGSRGWWFDLVADTCAVSDGIEHHEYKSLVKCFCEI